MNFRTLPASVMALLALSSTASALPATASLNPLSQLLVADSENSNPVPKVEKVTLVNLTFGGNATLTMKDSEGKQRTIPVLANAVIKNDKTTGSLTKMAQTELNKFIYVMTQRTNNVLSVTRMWDEESYTQWVSEHQGTRNGQVRGFYAKALLLGDHFYRIDDNTRFVLEGKNVGRKKLEGRDVLWVKCTVKNGVATADVIADTSTSIGADPNATRTRPASGGRPASTGNPDGPRTRGDSGTSPTERGNRERPASTGGDTQSPTERSKANNRSMTLEQRAAQDKAGWKVKVTIEILDANDNPGNGEQVEPVADLVGAAADQLRLGDQKVEVYSNFEIFGGPQLIWKREDAEDRKHQKGDKFVIKEGNTEWHVVKQNKLIFRGFIRDRDQLSKDDDLYTGEKTWTLYDLWVAKRTVFKSSNETIQFIIEVEK